MSSRLIVSRFLATGGGQFTRVAWMGRVRAAFALLLGGASGSLAADMLARNPGEYLQHYDRDRDGRIALGEYQDYLSRGFLQMDRNGDGRLSATELPPGTRGRRVPTLESHRRSLAIAFERQDVDRNGFLDARELAAPPR